MTHHHNAYSGRETLGNTRKRRSGTFAVEARPARARSVKLTPSPQLPGSRSFRRHLCPRQPQGQAHRDWDEDGTIRVTTGPGTPFSWPSLPRPAAVLLDVVDVMLRDGWARIETMQSRCGRVHCARRVDAFEEATREDDATLAGALSATHDAGRTVTEDMKHVEASAARRAEASIAVAASAHHRGLVCDRATSCAPWRRPPTQ